MKISTELKKVEAIERMKLLKIFPETRKQFEQDNCVSISEPPLGTFFWAAEGDLQRIRNFEKKYNALVYVVIRSYTTIGKLDNYLYVSDYADEWEQDREELVCREPLAYVYNHNAPDCSEFGCIGITGTPAAGLLRRF